MPFADYKIRIYSTAGVLQAELPLQYDARTINISHLVNYPSTATITAYGLASAIQYFTLDAIVEIQRKVEEAGLDWYTEFIGFHRSPQKQITTANNRIFTSYCRGLMDLIKRSQIRWYADTSGSAKGPAPADDIIKAYVRENAGILALASGGRVVDHVYSGLSVAVDSSQGPTIETAQAWQNLLAACRTVGESNQVDFDVLLSSFSPLTFTFQTYYPQLGTDRRAGTAAPQIFTPLMGNMEDPSYTQQRTDEITSALVLGPGEGPLRDTTLRVSAHSTDSPWNLIEDDIDASQEDRAVALQDIGDKLLYDKRAFISFPFTALQTPQSTYAKHYFVGDLVTAAFDDVSADVKIRGVNINVSGPEETVGLELEEIPNA